MQCCYIYAVHEVYVYFRPSRMVLAAAGGVDHDKLVDLAKQYFGTSVDEEVRNVTPLPCRYTGSDVS